MKLYARQQGHGPHLVSIHGLFGSQENLGAINRNLSDQFQVHGLDVRNHGRSPHSTVMDYTAMADDVLEYLDDQGLEKVDLLGHSMGGKIVMQLALLAPERIRKLVVMDIAPIEYAPRHDDVLKGLAAIDLSQLTNRSAADHLLQPFVQEQDVRQFLLKNLYRDGQRHFQWRINLEGIQTNYREIMKGQSADEPFRGEALFIKGSDSDYILPEHRDAVLALFPKAAVKVVAETGHWLHAQKPELVTRIIKRFLLE